MVSEDLLALLVCPMGKAPLRREGNTLICTRCGPRFEIKDDIPNMLIEEAELPAGGPRSRTWNASGPATRRPMSPDHAFVDAPRLDDHVNPPAGQVENLREKPSRGPMPMGQTDHEIARRRCRFFVLSSRESTVSGRGDTRARRR